MTQARLISSLAIVVVAIATITIVSVIGGGSASGDTSGPNASGYFWSDSNAPAPTTSFAWMDATGGTNLDALFHSELGSPNEDDGWSTVDLPFPFNFFGTEYTQVDVSTNGFLSFDIDNDCNWGYNWGGLDFGFDGHPIPHGEAFCDNQAEGWGANPLIALWFDDLDPGECGSVYHNTLGEAPNRMFVVEYSEVCNNDCSVCGPGEDITIEVILYEGSNNIKMQYMDTFFGTDAPDITQMNNGHSATIGLDKDATTGLQYSYRETINDGLAVLYSTTEPAGALTSTPSLTPVPTSTATPTPTPVATETATPTPTPAPTAAPLAQGDNDCDGDTDAVDALAGLRHVAALDVNQQAGCPALGGAVPAGATPDVFGDVDCDGDVDAVDALNVLRHVAALSVTQNEPCTDIGQAF